MLTKIRRQDDPHNLKRFLSAQNQIIKGVRVIDRACNELLEGRKKTHWMWFVFPQIAGLGGSEISRKFAIASLEEARAYLRHEVLGPRLFECVGLVNKIKGQSIRMIFKDPDDMKFRSCVTLFAHATVDNKIFYSSLTKFFGGELDRRTVMYLRR